MLINGLTGNVLTEESCANSYNPLIKEGNNATHSI
nr:MAG TPA: hypothetical protein [Caudoviricetes sp.]